MVLQHFLKLWHLYFVGCLAYFFWNRCFLYDIIALISPHLFHPDLLPEYEQRLELREELLDLNLREALLERELENLPMDIMTSSSEVETDSVPDSDSQAFANFYLKINMLFLFYYSLGGWTGPHFEGTLRKL